MTDYKIHLKDFVLTARVGILPAEKLKKQNIKIDITLDATPPKNWAIDQMVDYSMVRDRIIKLCAARHYDMLEELAVKIVDDCLTIPTITCATITINKPDIFDGNPIPAITWRANKK